MGVESLQPDDVHLFEGHLFVIECPDCLQRVSIYLPALFGSAGFGISAEIVGEALLAGAGPDLHQQLFDFRHTFPDQFPVVLQVAEGVRILEEQRLDALVDGAGVRALREYGLVDLSVPVFWPDVDACADGRNLPF